MANSIELIMILCLASRIEETAKDAAHLVSLNCGKSSEAIMAAKKMLACVRSEKKNKSNRYLQVSLSRGHSDSIVTMHR